MTDAVKNFLQANAKSPVIVCSVGDGGRGARYTLEDGSQYVLTREECAMIGMPRWKLS